MKLESRAPLILAAALPLLLLLYVGSYLALVRPRPDGDDYHPNTNTLRWVFWPLEQIDRKVRPNEWLIGDLHQATQATRLARPRTSSLGP